MPVADTMQKNALNEMHTRMQTMAQILQFLQEKSLDKTQVKLNRAHNELCITKLEVMQQKDRPISFTFAADKSDICQKTLEKVQEYNAAHPTDPINIINFKDDANRTEVWVQRDQASLFYDLQKEALTELGKVQAEMEQENFKKYSAGTRSVKVSGLDEDTVQRIENKGWQNDFPYATEITKDGKMNVAVTVDHFMDGKINPKSEDLFTTLMRETATADPATLENLHYDLNLEDKIMSHSEKEPLFICNQGRGNSFLQVDADKFTVYNVHQDMNNPNLAIKQEVKRNDFSTSQEYERTLYKAYSELSNPTLVTAKDLDKVSTIYQNKDLSKATNQDIKDAIMYHCSRGKVIAGIRPDIPHPTALFKLDRAAKAYGNLLEFKLMQVEAKANVRQFMQPLLNAGLNPAMTKDMLLFAARELSKENTITMEDKDIYQAMITKMSKYVSQHPEITAQEKKAISSVLQDMENKFQRADVLNDPNLYQKAIQETTEYIAKKGSKASKEWEQVMNLYHSNDENFMNKIPIDKLVLAAEKVLNLHIECRTPSIEDPMLTEEEHQVKEYHQATRLDEAKESNLSNPNEGIEDIDTFDDLDI